MKRRIKGQKIKTFEKKIIEEIDVPAIGMKRTIRIRKNRCLIEMNNSVFSNVKNEREPGSQ